jgi:hypothetical protein
MAGPAPKTRNWRARENEHEPAGLHIIVSGEVEVSATTKHPQLAEAPHAGKVLPLDLTIAETGLGAELVVWMAARFHKEVSANEFDHVEIRWDGKVIATAPVVDDSEHHALASKPVKAPNAPAKVKTAKAKKAAPKKASPAKAVKKVAKKAAKKVTKKTSKKRAAPKSAFKKFVKKMVKKLTPKKAPKKKAKKSKKKR